MLFSPTDCTMGNQVIDPGSASGLFSIRVVVTDAGQICGQSFRSMIGNTDFALVQPFFPQGWFQVFETSCALLKTQISTSIADKLVCGSDSVSSSYQKYSLGLVSVYSFLTLLLSLLKMQIIEFFLTCSCIAAQVNAECQDEMFSCHLYSLRVPMSIPSLALSFLLLNSLISLSIVQIF